MILSTSIVGLSNVVLKARENSCGTRSGELLFVESHFI